MVHLSAARYFLFSLIPCLATSARPRTAGPVRVSVSNDSRTAVVHFKHGLKDHVYHLEAASVFAEGAEIISHTDAGEERVKAPAVTMFRAVEDRQRATARIHADGSVTGLFEHEGEVVRVAPSHMPRNASQRVGRSLHEDSMPVVTAGTGEAAHVHDFSYLPPLDLLGGNRQTPRRRLHGKDADMVAFMSDAFRRLDDEEEPELKIDNHKDFTPEDQRSDLPSDEMPRVGAQIAAMTQWAGVRWYPSCYPGDDKVHEFKVGVVLDNEAWTRHSLDIEQHIADAIAQSSLVYEKQMNIRLTIGEFVIYKSAIGAPAYAVGCPDTNLMETKLNQLRQGSGYNFMGSTHLFTGCGTDYGVVGLAYVGTICNKYKYNIGVDQIHDYNSENTFLIFAHELGHNFGGDHSFEEGEGTTGGIMDYGDGHLNGVYQFNTKYRKAEMCETMNRVAGRCQGKFDPASAPAPTPPSLTPAPTLIPTLAPAPGPTPRPDGGSGPCKTVSARGAGIGKECVFPFEYKDITYHGCTPEGHVNLWCPTAEGLVDGKTEGPTKGGGNWGECSWSPQCIGLDSPCRTTKDGSDEPGPDCVFPFKYRGFEYKTCTWVGHHKFWCATKVNEKNEMEEWANCEKSDYCSNHWKTVGWAGIPEDKIWEFGNQAQHKLDALAESSAWQGFTNFFRNLWCAIARIWGGCSAEEAADGTTASATIQGKSEVFQGLPTRLGFHWDWVSSAGFGFSMIFVTAFVIHRAVRTSSFRALHISPSTLRANGNADDHCEQSLLME